MGPNDETYKKLIFPSNKNVKIKGRGRNLDFFLKYFINFRVNGDLRSPFVNIFDLSNSIIEITLLCTGLFCDADDLAWIIIRIK